MPKSWPLALMFMIMSQLSSSMSMNILGLFTPAFSSATLIEPKAFTVSCTAAVLSSRLVTSSLTAIALPPPAPLMRSATSLTPSTFTSPKQTLAPCAAKYSALAAPMPWAAPVIRMFLPFRRLGSMTSSSSV